MTHGNPAKIIGTFAVPVILGRFLQLAYNMADTVIVGRTIGVDALAAVGATGTIYSFFVSAISGFMSGFSIVAGKKYGARDYEGLKKVFVNGAIITFALCFLLTLLCTVFTKPMLRLMNTPDDIIGESHTYLFVLFAGITATMLYNFACEIMRALGNSKRPFVYLLFSSVVNIVLDLLFIIVFKMGVAGAALATVLAQVVSAVLCGVYMCRSIDYFKTEKSDIRVDFKVCGECFRIGIPAATLSMVIMSGLIIKQAFLNGIGTDCIAAYSAASKIESIYTIPLYSLVSAMMVFIAQNYGAGDLKRVKLGIRHTMGIMFAINGVAIAVSLITSKLFVGMIVGDAGENIIYNGTLYVNIHVLFMLVLVPLIVYKGALQALGRTLFPTISGFLEVAARLIVVMVFTRLYGFTGILLTDPITWTVTCVFFIVTYNIEIRKVGGAKMVLTEEAME